MSDHGQDYFMNYKSAYTILADYRLDDLQTRVILEIRKGAKLGCELFTVIAGIPYHVYSKLLRGCMTRLFLELPQRSSIMLPHSVGIGINGHSAQLIEVEETYTSTTSCVEDISTFHESNPSIFLSYRDDDVEFHTSQYEIDDIDEALKELKTLLEDRHNARVTIRTCRFCHFMSQYANTEICLRDIKSQDFNVVQEMILRREHPVKYYKRIAWDVDEFHQCSAFISDE
jgi:hypothetical protein